MSEADGGWRPIFAPTAEAFEDGDIVPQEIDHAGIQRVVQSFADAAQRALTAGAKIVEIHAAHGYLIHEFLSPLTNKRRDEYGGSFENRTRLAREAVESVRRVWPERYPLLVRVSASDWVEGSWDAEQSAELAKVLKQLGVDMIDCSSGGAVPNAKIAVGPSYQVLFSERIRHEAGIATAAVGMITEAEQANEIIAEGRADMVFLARAFLREPYWPLKVAAAMGVDLPPPVQYGRAFTKR